MLMKQSKFIKYFSMEDYNLITSLSHWLSAFADINNSLMHFINSETLWVVNARQLKCNTEAAAAKYNSYV